MTTIDNLRETIAKSAARSQGDETPIIHTAAQLRAAVAEHDALRDECDEARATAAQRLDALRSANDAVHAEVTALDALRNAVRGYLATVGVEEVTPRCAAAVGCSAPATGIVRWGPSAEGRREGRYLCHAHAVSGDHHAPLPPRVVTLRALAALVRS